MRSILAAVTLAVLAACGGQKDGGDTAAVAEEKVLAIYNWSDYIGEATIADFEKKTGIKVQYDVYDSNEVLETKLLSGKTGYDVVVPTATFLERQITAGVFRKLDKSKLPNLANLDPALMERIAVHDPGNEHAINYVWGTTGIGFNKALVEKALGTTSIDGWEAVFDPTFASKLAGCGITMLDSATDVFESVLIYLGKDPTSEDRANLAAAEDVLMKVRPYIRYFHSSQYINDLATGEICVALGWSGNMFLARDRGAEAGTPVEIAYVIPRQGAVMWFDMLAIPADAPHPDNAHAFLNYIMEPEVIASISNYLAFANGNVASLAFVDESLRNDPTVYPDAEMMMKLYPDKAETQDYSRDLNRAWTRVRTGQ